MSAKRPVAVLTYQGVAAGTTTEIGALTSSIEYTDHMHGKSDELSITVSNHDGRWFGGWWPAKGDELEASIGYEGEALLPCGTFRIDKVEAGGMPDTLTIHALAAGVASKVRTRGSRAFDATTLKEIAEHLASELELDLEGDIEDIAIDRVSMDQETTLTFLRRLAEDYGYVFSIRNNTRLCFYRLATLEAVPPVLTISYDQLQQGTGPVARRGYRLSGEVANTYVACEVSFFDPLTKKLVTVRVDQEKPRQEIVIAGSSSGAPVIPRRILAVGTQGDDVRAWQDFLTSTGIDAGPVDGIYGPKTRAGTVRFQRANELRQDGAAGPESFRVAVSLGFDMAKAATQGTRAEVAGNVLRATVRAESVAQAELKAKAMLQKANRIKATGSIPLVGHPGVVAGANIEIVGMGRMSGVYSIESSKHKQAKTYETDIEVKCVS